MERTESGIPIFGANNAIPILARLTLSPATCQGT
jgi:hypothetical protein